MSWESDLADDLINWLGNDGQILAQANITRVPGNPNEQEVTLTLKWTYPTRTTSYLHTSQNDSVLHLVKGHSLRIENETNGKGGLLNEC